MLRVAAGVVLVGAGAAGDGDDGNVVLGVLGDFAAESRRRVRLVATSKADGTETGNVILNFNININVRRGGELIAGVGRGDKKEKGEEKGWW